MAHMLIRHKVADFGKWKPVFDEHRPAREAAGLKDVNVWRNTDNSNEVVALFNVSDVAKAKEFTASSELKEKMEAAGVQGAPDIVFLSED